MNVGGKTALVAGATREIGRNIARALAAGGARLVLPWHDDWPGDAASLREEFGGEGFHILLKTDLRKPEEVRMLADSIRKTAGSLDILVNNIERGGMPVVHGSYDKEVNRDQWRLEQETTLLAKRLLFESFLPLLKKAPEAAVVNISSIAAVTGRSGPASLVFSDGYAAANRAVSILTETWARLGAPTIRVNELMLGLIDTRHGKKTRGWETLTPAQREALTNHTLLKRTGTPREVVEAVLFLVSASYLTGSVLRLDGGYLLGGEPVAPMPEGILDQSRSPAGDE
ncbi:MAG: 3-oxoacyl-[acyl-carrier-protein] reductase [Desulfobulbaceae bacterium]